MSSEPLVSNSGPQPHDPADVVVVVVTHGGPSEMLRRCLASIAAGGGAPRVVVVDNGEATGRERTGGDYGPGADEIIQMLNEGFGAAVNRGIRDVLHRGAAAVAVLNDDVEVTAGWLDPLIGALALRADVGAVQPKLLLAGTTPPLVNSVGVELDRAMAGSDVGFGEPDGAAWSASRDIEIFTGGAVLFRTAFLAETGGFDERFFLYYEDVDLALRGAALGWRYRCEPASVVLHAPGSSTAALGPSLIRCQEHNRLWIAFRFGSGGSISRALWLSVRRLRHPPRRAHAQALATGLAAVPRILVERARAARRRIS